MKQYQMCQCWLKQHNQIYDTSTTSWIPEKFAKLGKILQLKNLNGWSNGWEVISVGARKSSSFVIERSSDYRTHRNGSDV